MATFKAEMKLHDKKGARLYLTKDERDRFLSASISEDREKRLFCHVLHFTGCRISEALLLTADQILIEDKVIVLQTLKKRKLDKHGNTKEKEYRRIDVPIRLIEDLDLVFNLRQLINKKEPGTFLLWPQSRTTAWRLIKRVLDKAGIEGEQAKPKGFRHGFGIAMAQTGMPLTVLKELLGHADVSTTEIYLQFVDEEKRSLVMKAWE